jgi:hypothetical protein
MKDRAKFYYRVAAFFFAGSIMTAALTGCVYGPPPEDKKAAINPEKNMRPEIALVVNTNDKKKI